MDDKKAIDVFKALADPTRLRIVRSLASCPTGQKTCGDLSSRVKLSQPAMSHHFGKLAEAQIITETKVGTQKKYLLNKPMLSALGIDVNKI